MSYNRVTLHSAIVHAQGTTQGSGTAGSRPNPTERGFWLWDMLCKSGARLRGDHHGFFAWHAAMHHLHCARNDPAYAADGYTFAIYTTEVFEEYAAAERIAPDMPGALLVTRARVSRRTLVTGRSPHHHTLRFAPFRPVSIPRTGVWALYINDVDSPNEPPELLFNHYSIDDSEIAAMQTPESGGALLPLALMLPHRAETYQPLGIATPRLLLRLRARPSPAQTRACDIKYVELSSTALEMNMTASRFAPFMQSELGETTMSVTAHIGGNSDYGSPNGDTVLREKDALAAVFAKHRVSDMSVLFTTSEGHHVQLGNPGQDVNLGSQFFAMVAIMIAIGKTLDSNAGKIVDEIARLSGGTEPAVAYSDSVNGVQAMFNVMAPGKGGDMIVDELKRIYVSNGFMVPTLRDLMGLVNTGLELPPPTQAGLQQMMNDALSGKLDSDLSSGGLMSREYVARMLGSIERPRWGATRSTLAVALLLAAMPEDFVRTVTDVLRKDMDMPDAVFVHAASPGVPNKGTRTTPGLYAQASMDSMGRAARRLFSSPVVMHGQATENAQTVRNLLHAYEEKPTTLFTAAQLVFRVYGALGELVFAQANAAVAEDPATETMMLDPARISVIFRGKDTLVDGSSLMLLLHPQTHRYMLVRARVEDSHRKALARDLLGLFASSLPASKSVGNKNLARLVQLAEHSIAMDARRGEMNSSPLLNVAEQVALLSSWAKLVFVPITMAANTASLQIVRADSKSVEVRFDSSESLPDSGPDARVYVKEISIGEGPTQLVAAVVPLTFGEKMYNVKAIQFGRTLYVEKEVSQLLHAIQNTKMMADSQQPQNVDAAVDVHDPYGLQNFSSSFSTGQLGKNGERTRLLQAKSRQIVGANGLIVSRSERNDPTIYNKTLDDWGSPFV